MTWTLRVVKRHGVPKTQGQTVYSCHFCYSSAFVRGSPVRIPWTLCFTSDEVGV